MRYLASNAVGVTCSLIITNQRIWRRCIRPGWPSTGLKRCAELAQIRLLKMHQACSWSFNNPPTIWAMKS